MRVQGRTGYPAHPPYPPSLPQKRGEKGGKIGKLGVWGSEAAPNTQFSGIFPFTQLGESDRAKLGSGDGGVRP
jgi:hypothetical protein